MAQCKGVLFTMNIQRNLFSLSARISGKNDKLDVRYSSEITWYDFYHFVTEREDFEVVKDISKYSFGGLQNLTLSQMFPTLKESLDFVIKGQGNYGS
jgi:hypothetical protein